MSAEERKNTTLIPASQADEDFEMWQSVSESSSSESAATETRLATKSLRPTAFADYIGQEKVIENITIACAAARNRGDSIDHILLHGPPGLGKTSLARIVAGELGVGFKSTSGPVIERPGDLAAILTSLAAGDVLFIDEIHRLPRVVEEVLYPAMEDFQLDILIGQGPSAKSVRIDLKPFSLVGATTRSGMLTSPLRDRFGMVLRLDFYKAEELSLIIQRSADIMSLQLAPEAALEIARRSRGTPRIANRILKRLRDFTQYRGESEASIELAKLCLEKLEIDALGLERMDRLIIETIIDTFAGGPVGIDSMAAAIGEERVTIEDVYEPFLIQKGLLMRTRQGRVATEAAYEHIGRKFERLQQEISFESGEDA